MTNIYSSSSHMAFFQGFVGGGGWGGVLGKYFACLMQGKKFRLLCLSHFFLLALSIKISSQWSQLLLTTWWRSPPSSFTCLRYSFYVCCGSCSSSQSEKGCGCSYVSSKTALAQSVLVLQCNNPLEVVCFHLKCIMNDALRSASKVLDHRGRPTRWSVHGPS